MKQTEQSLLDEFTQRVDPLDQDAMREARERLDQLTKPPGSLGRLEELAVQLAGMTGRVRQRLQHKTVVLMAADHGVASEGVSAYPKSVTAQMVLNFLKGGAAINVLARRAGARVLVVDMGVAADLPNHRDLITQKMGRGTDNFTLGPAMAPQDALAAIEAGRGVAREEIEHGCELLATGDMGIGNTTASSAITAVLLEREVHEVAGRGTGLDDGRLRRKVGVIERAIALNEPEPSEPLDVLAKLGGYEIAGLVGVVLEAASQRVPVIIDGFISGAAALVAVRLCAPVRSYLIAAHCSTEPGHNAILTALGLKALFDLELRLGEGTGAVLAMHLVDDALAILDEMATFEEAGVADRA